MKRLLRRRMRIISHRECIAKSLMGAAGDFSSACALIATLPDTIPPAVGSVQEQCVEHGNQYESEGAPGSELLPGQKLAPAAPKQQ